MRALLLAFAAVLLAGCTAIGPIALADGVYLLPGVPGAVDARTLGRVGNAGFIVGATSVLAIDTGTSWRHGTALLAAIHRVTDQPVRLTVITHARQEFLFGAAAFRERGIPILMHRDAAALMAARCERCLKQLKEALGEDEMQGTAMFTPDRLFDIMRTIDPIGQPVQLLDFGRTSGPGDVAVFDVRSGVLFAGGLLDHRRIPDIQDSDLTAWLLALESLRALPIRVIVPGHGPAGSVAMIDAQVRYLTLLQARVQQLLRDGVGLGDVPDAAALPEFADWDQYPTLHRRNAATLFIRLERELLQD